MGGGENISRWGVGTTAGGVINGGRKMLNLHKQLVSRQV